MRREIGGYIELQGGAQLNFPDALHLNSARNCLAYAIEARGIAKIALPDLLCDSVRELCAREHVSYRFYQVNEHLEPDWNTVSLDSDEFLYLVDYYGLLQDSCVEQAKEASAGRLIIDEAQALCAPAREGIDTLFSPRKFLGLPDGGFLRTNAHINRFLPQAESGACVGSLLGRVEHSAAQHLEEHRENDDRLRDEPLMRMSRLTERLLGTIDIDQVAQARLRNYRELERALRAVNRLELVEPACPFAYPLLVEDAAGLREQLASRGVYVPTLWSDVLANALAGQTAKRLAKNILPLPCDQRYSFADMAYILDVLREVGVLQRPLAGKKVAILGGTRISCEIVEAARALGMHTTVIDYNTPQDSPAKPLADAHAQISVADVREVAAYLKEHAIDGVLTGYSDMLLPLYADICEQAGLPCYATRAQFETFSDKRQWKELCRAYQVPTARQYPEEIAQLPEEEIPFPLFVKPSDASGARGTAIVRNKEQLLAALQRAKGFARNGAVILEDYLEGPELTVFWVFVSGRYELSLLGNRLVKNNQAGVIPLPAGYSFPSSALPRYEKEIAPRVREMLKSQGVENGMMFMQCIVQDGIPFVYDIGYRLTGSLEHHLTKAAAGYSCMDMLLRFAVTGAMSEGDPTLFDKVSEGLRKPCYNVSFLMKPGTIDHFSGLDALAANPTVVSYAKAHIEGETLPEQAKGELRQIALRVLGATDAIQDVEAAMMEVQETVKIYSPQGENLVLPGLEGSDFVGNLLVGERQ